MSRPPVNPVAPGDVKTCNLCHEAKPTAEFNVRAGGSLYGHCKACHSAICKRARTPYAELSPEEKARAYESSVRWRKTHPDKVRQFRSNAWQRVMSDPEKRRQRNEKARAYRARQRAQKAAS